MNSLLKKVFRIFSAVILSCFFFMNEKNKYTNIQKLCYKNKTFNSKQNVLFDHSSTKVLSDFNIPRYLYSYI